MKAHADWLIGDLSGSELELTDEQRMVLRGHAEMYLRANGVLPWERWIVLGEESKAAFMEAGTKLRDEMANSIARYVVGLLDEDRNGNGQENPAQ